MSPMPYLDVYSQSSNGKINKEGFHKNIPHFLYESLSNALHFTDKKTKSLLEKEGNFSKNIKRHILWSKSLEKKIKYLTGFL